jgi:hypothetical protein
MAVHEMCLEAVYIGIVKVWSAGSLSMLLSGWHGRPQGGGGVCVVSAAIQCFDWGGRTCEEAAGYSAEIYDKYNCYSQPGYGHYHLRMNIRNK